MSQELVEICLGERSYRIEIGAGLLSRKEAFLGLPAAIGVVVVSNTTVAPLYAQQLRSTLLEIYPHVHCLNLPD